MVDFFLGCSSQPLRRDSQDQTDGTMYDHYENQDPDDCEPGMFTYQSGRRTSAVSVETHQSVIGSGQSDQPLRSKTHEKLVIQTPIFRYNSDLIPVSLDPPSPLTLDKPMFSKTKANRIASLSQESTTPQSTPKMFGQDRIPTPEPDQAVESLAKDPVFAYISHGLVPDARVHDQFYGPSLLEQGDSLFVPSQPVFATVDELLQQLYPDLDPTAYAQHHARLSRNRQLLEAVRYRRYNAPPSPPIAFGRRQSRVKFECY